ncbi:MAG: hypothetical protein FJ276_01395 [Planctomycetes bacterium]|nr:hypothetical protein [Planctomycetota bacterium]
MCHFPRTSQAAAVLAFAVFGFQSVGRGAETPGEPAAKQQLIDGGMDRATVDSMPVGQVVAIQSARTYRKVYQQSMKWTLLPYWQSHQQMRATFAELDAQGFLGGRAGNMGGMPGAIPIASMLLPSIEPAVFAPVRLQRELAALQTIEALRMAAARADGRLPKSLDELSFAPTPIDQLTGRPVEYQLLEDGVGVLTLSAPEGRSASSLSPVTCCAGGASSSSKADRNT